MPEAFFRPRPFGLPNFATFEPNDTGSTSPGSEFLTFTAHLAARRAETTGKPLGALATMADRVEGYLYSVRYRAKQRGDQPTYQIADRMYFSLYTYAYSYFHPVNQYENIRHYNKMQETYAREEHPLRGEELSTQETQLLSELLDEASVPHDLRNVSGTVCIPFAPLEEKMRKAAATIPIERGYYLTSTNQDHESRTRRDVGTLMNEWEKRGEGNS